MKTFATKVNPAFKIAQPLPSWPVGYPGGDHRAATARRAENSPTQDAAPRVAIDLALSVLPSKREFCAATCR